jgi:hypothetical protein
MPIPAAMVDIAIVRITGLDPDPRKTANLAYFRATIGPRETGRSRPIPRAVTEFDFSVERTQWQQDVAVAAIVPYLDGDRNRLAGGDAAPIRIAREHFDLAAPWTSGNHTFGTSFQVEVAVATRAAPQPGQAAIGVVPKKGAGSSVNTVGTLAVRTLVAVELTDILGLYEPVKTPILPGEGQHARRRAGYLSEDNAGRIFRNRALDGTWKKDTQLIELSVKITALRGTVPAGAKVRWVMIDRDDPINDRTDLHQQWGPYIDANDHDAAGKPEWARVGDDDHGIPDRTPRWEEVPGFDLTIRSDEVASTLIIGNVSKVRLHCTNVSGANFVVRAVMDSLQIDELVAQTGLMTIWDRIDVEYLRMASALPIDAALADVPSHFALACIQFDVAAPVIVPDKDPMLTQRNGSDEVNSDEVNDFIDGATKHQSEPAGSA